METKVKIPESLPWKVGNPDDYPVSGKSHSHVETWNGLYVADCQFGSTAHNHAAYIVHAANNYPALVEALEDCLRVFADPRFTDRYGHADRIRAILAKCKGGA